MEFVPRATTEQFIRCHLNAFAKFGGIPKKCLYDNTKLVVLSRDSGGAPVWNRQFLDFALRLGIEVQLCRPYRAQTKGRVESGIKYVKHNFWPTARFSDLDDLNRHMGMDRHGCRRAQSMGPPLNGLLTDSRWSEPV